METTPLLQMLRRHRAFASLSLTLLATVSACVETSETNEAASNSNLVSDEALAPRLLQDLEQTTAFVAAFSAQDYEIAEVPELGRFYIDDNPAWMKRELKEGRPWEPGTQVVMTTHTRAGTTALDIGAHIGSHSVTLSHLVGPEGAVYSFEPQRKIYRELVMNLELNKLENVIPLRFAIGAENKLVEMTPTSDFDGRMFVGKGGDGVELRTIDSFGFSNVSIMKIDVEGFELEVLKGAVETIATWHPAIVIEITGFYQYDRMPPNGKKLVDDVLAFFERMNYEFKFIEYAGEPHFLALHVPPTS